MPSTGDRRRSVAGYPSGPDAPLRATANALESAGGARSVILVEGVSDQIAAETLAVMLGRDLAAEGVLVIPVGGAQAITPFLRRFGPLGEQLRVGGLCDVGEERYIRRALGRAGFDEPSTRGELEQLGFFVCERDLEDELIRAMGTDAIEAVLTAQDDLGSFHSLQKQPAWRDSSFDEQFRRFLGAGAGRKSRYARLLVRALELDRQPSPLLGVLSCA